MATDVASLIDTTTIVSLLSTIAILLAAYTLSIRLLPQNASGKTRVLFVWHAFDALIHFCLEAGYLYNCFFSWIPRDATISSAYLPPNVHFLGLADRLYGAEYGTNPLSALWREYAKADARWGGSDLTVICLEILTVGLAAPMCVYVCYCLVQCKRAAWFWMTVVAVGELYGGWMTFGPEWLSGCPNLDTSNWMYMWLYLFFFNMLWVWLPFWVLYVAYDEMVGESSYKATAGSATKKKR